jgi:hypothetical protein
MGHRDSVDGAAKKIPFADQGEHSQFEQAESLEVSFYGANSFQKLNPPSSMLSQSSPAKSITSPNTIIS